MVVGDSYLSIVESIYDAAADPGLWSVALEKLAAPSRGKAFLAVRDPMISAASWPTIYVGMERSWLDAYYAHYASRVAWMATRVPKRPPGVATPSDNVINRSELIKTEWYNDFMRPQKLISGIGVSVLRDRSRFISAGLLVPLEAEDEKLAHIALVQQVTPHLERALKVNRQLSRANFQWQAAEQCFNRLSVGIILLSATMKVKFSNTEAERIFRQEDGLGQDRDGCLRAGSSDDDARLRTSVRSLVSATPAGARPVTSDHGGVLAIRRRSGKRPYGLLISGIRPPPGLFGGEDPSVIVFVAEGRSRQPSGQQLAEAFGLTPAESRLLQVLLQGHGLTEAASRLGNSVNTAKTHLRALFDKLECSRQADLISAVTSHPVWFVGQQASHED